MLSANRKINKLQQRVFVNLLLAALLTERSHAFSTLICHRLFIYFESWVPRNRRMALSALHAVLVTTFRNRLAVASFLALYLTRPYLSHFHTLIIRNEKYMRSHFGFYNSNLLLLH
jgi:hypothetical protein